ncbi:MAG TPA: Ppx/GppA family phosphatase [Bacteroidetes bacterium]|nr:Ppx/GppA family phosphatase [Bacteroidota bacterium]
MNVAAIDIGTNTVLLLVAQIDADGKIIPVVYEQRIPRLGNGVDAQKNLQPESIRRVVDVLKEYRATVTRFNLEKVIVAGTSAVRDAHNREDLALLIKNQVGFDLEVLSGDDEAYWTYRGATSGVPGVQRATVVDIGGGSTEITIGNARTVENKISLNVGSVRLTERFFKHDPPTHTELESAITCVEDELAKAKGFDFEDRTLIGVAGTATSLAMLDQGCKEFSIDAVTNYHLKLDNVNALFRTLRAMPSVEILNLSSVMQGRNDVIVAGTLILREIMAHYKFTEMIVNERGVRYGLAIREWEKSLSTHQGVLL